MPMTSPPLEAAEGSTASGRPHKVRKTRAGRAAPQQQQNQQPTWSPEGVEDALDSAGEEAAASEVRSCENCRRSKLKCSRSSPCSKCALKGVPCVYEPTDKKRGPRPGYIEELYRRIDALEHMVLGQSLMLKSEHMTPSESSAPTTIREALDLERHRLGERALSYYRGEQGEQRQQFQQGKFGAQRQDFSRLQVASSAQQQQSPTSSAPSGNRERTQHDANLPANQVASLSHDLLQQLSIAFRHQIQPWVPILCERDVTAMLRRYEPAHALEPLLQAMFAATSPYVTPLRSSHEQYFAACLETDTRNVLQSAGLNQLRSSVILMFLLFGKGSIDNHWGLITYLPQLAQRAGLHLENHHLTSEHREFRRMSKFDDGSDQGWTSTETARRLFWNLLLLDHFAAALSGTRPGFDVQAIRRLLPCDGQHWHDGTPVHTREFVPASLVTQMQAFADTSIGGLAYLIEATDIRAMVMAFVSAPRDALALKRDARACLQEFLNLDLVMTSWKARLPVRYQQAAYDENGYMDHNVTLAHLTHNTSGILLYQWPHAIDCATAAGANLQTTLLPQLSLIKQVAKEISKICIRFLLHRHYLLSPQFSFCPFIAARALLAYASWMIEPVDEDYGTLCSVLEEAGKRWDGAFSGATPGDDFSATIPHGNFATMLRQRLEVDAKNPSSIDLTAPTIHLLREIGCIDGLAGELEISAAADGELAVDASGSTIESGMPMIPSSIGILDDLNGAMSFHLSTNPGNPDARFFAWPD